MCKITKLEVLMKSQIEFVDNVRCARWQYELTHNALRNLDKILKVPKMKIIEYANSIDLDEAAHHELPLLDQCCLPCCL